MEIFFTSLIAFASTNLDDIFILILFFGDKRFKTRDVYLGQYLGIIMLIGASILGSLAGNFIDSKYIGLLGLFPIYLGLKQILFLIKKKNEEGLSENEVQLKTGFLAVATVTVAKKSYTLKAGKATTVGKNKLTYNSVKGKTATITVG